MSRPPLHLVVRPEPERSLARITIDQHIRARAEALLADARVIQRALLTGPACPESKYAEAVKLMEGLNR